ncbi:acyltransferase family protein [Sodalis sp. RH21]|uniref:acyltransferase family protein n=1 Tax=unclassified Sodalis (in: enterobacteria) TaxID=2636512 RepID=UPI0039B4CBA9
MNNKVLFADQLRSLAFLSVVVVHWFGVFWAQPKVISDALNAPEIEEISSNIYYQLLPPLTNFNYGPFGVSLFFLISGFVIPFSLSKKTRSGFLIARALRIYPVYIISSLIMLLTLYLTSKYYWGTAKYFDFYTILKNLTLTQSIFNAQSIDMVNWTLSIELKFYFFCVLFYSAINNAKIFPIFLLGLFSLILIYTTNSQAPICNIGQFSISFSAIKDELIYMCFMSIGILFHFNHMQKISTNTMVVSGVGIISIILLMCKIKMDAASFSGLTLNYSYGLTVFFMVFLLRDKVKKVKILAFLSGISYPFYVLHSIVGYSMLRILVDKGINFIYAFTFTFVVVLLIAFLMHATIEKYTIQMGRHFK